MSIWSSVFEDEVDGRSARASDFEHPECKPSDGTGAEELVLGVATTYHDAIRLDIDPYPRQGVDRQLLLSRESAETLRDMLDVALRRGEQGRSS